MAITWEELENIKALYTRLAPNSIPSPPPSPPPPPPKSSQFERPWAAWCTPACRDYPVETLRLKLPGLVISGSRDAGVGGGGKGSDYYYSNDYNNERFEITRQQTKNVLDEVTHQERRALYENELFATHTGNFVFVPIIRGKTTIRLQYLFDKK